MENADKDIKRLSNSLTFGYNFRGGVHLTDNEKQIVKIVENGSFSITPLEVSSIAKIKHSTVKVLMRKLAKNGVIQRKYHGHYVSAKNPITFGSSVVGEAGVPLLHSIRFRVEGLVGADPKRWCRKLGEVVRIMFKVYSNGTAIAFIDCRGDACLDYVGFAVVADVVCHELKVSNWRAVTVTNFEFNYDFHGVRLDGFKGVTLKAFDGSFHRLYQKQFGVRDEVKVVGPQKIENVLTLMQGGVSSYNILQLLFRNWQRLGNLVECQRFQNRLTCDAVSAMKRLVDSLVNGNSE